MSFGKGHHLHLIDGSGFIFRAYHALPPLTRKSDGLPVGAVSGFCNMLFKIIEDQKGSNAPTHLVVVFDAKGKTFRSDIYPEYKMNRPPAPEDLIPQFPLTRDATRAFGLACIEQEGFEADDIMATLAVQAREAGGHVTIVSSDKDLMQLVGNGVEMYDAMKNKRIGPEQVEEKFGVAPNRVIDVQSLAGDSVDNVPGAPGIGVKTAALLINEYGDLDSLLERASEIKQPKRRETLIDNADQIRTSRDLVTLKTDMEMDCDFDDFQVQAPNPEVVLKFLAEMEFRTMSARIANKLGVSAPEISSDRINNEDQITEAEPISINTEKYELIDNVNDLNRWVTKIYQRGYVAVDTETTGLNDMIVDLVGICLSVEIGEACYIPVGHTNGEDDLFGGASLCNGQINLDEALEILRPVLQDPSIIKIGQNVKYDTKIFARYDVNLAPVDDTMLLSYAINGGKHNHGMDYLSERYLNHKPISIKTLLGSGKSAITFDKVSINDAVNYAAEDADITLRLWKLFKPMLHESSVTKVYETLERPLIPVLAKMEMNGIKVDRNTLSRMSNNFAQSMSGLEAEIYNLAGQTFNVGSPKQLGEILFDKLELPGGKKGKTGAYGTGVDVLEDLASEGHELPVKVLDWRQMSKLKSTYTDALQGHINPNTGRVHTSYVISGASTGRLSSTDPNLQNIPIRSEAGRKIREAFIAEEGNVLLSLDYSQIELRILAHIAKIDTLKQAFHEGQDIHALTASQMFNVPLENMDPMVRRQAKAINFGVIYGISGFGLARNLRIPRKEAQSFIDTYFERFPGIRTYMDETVSFAKENGYVETLFGRKIHTSEINAKGPQAGFAKRAAINAPIQGTAADVIRRAMVQMPNAISHLPAKMLLQVHDELIFEVNKDALNETIEVVRNIMEKASEPVVKLDVPLVVDADFGNNWADAH
ncbi:DNA polymerase I [Amylibacter sp.]|nr:DNA polymerase I [Amylibacter sp.]MDB4044924.1 DNA polymerase I [Amylibacter sp.]MDB4132271.1 DNA polymerase I [Amylibacter sp.]MDC0095633.1 DNA polymerase I [Amylibacter sp.]MDC0120622.1 DNA polymerase I [Amylibacter sp.]